MSWPGGSTLNFGSPIGAYGSGSMTRGRIQGGSPSGVNYPNPFFDVAHTYLPTTIKELFRYCRYYFLTNPLINAIIYKMSEYPITDLIIDHEDDSVKRKWEEYFHDHLSYRSFQIDVGLDYNCTGNSLPSISYPFKKYLTCSNCGFSERAEKLREFWTFTNFEFRMTCPKCGTIDAAIARDDYYRSATGIRLLRWNVEDVEVFYNELSGETTHFYNIPGVVRSDIIVGKKDVVESVPDIFIQALRQQKGIVFNRDNIFHMKRPTLAGQDRGWGVPLILPVLKKAFHLQLMQKAMEAILLEHIVPLRILFPQAAGGSSDPFTTINLTQWREQVAAEIGRWRYDQNYLPIMPLPLGFQSIGGEGRSLMLTQEMQAYSEEIIMGMGAPLEFLKGGLSYSGSNVSMRMLENAFIGSVLRHKQLANWVMKRVANYMEWPVAKVRFKPFKMADDLQRKAYMFQMNQAQKVSDTTLLSDSDLDQKLEDELMLKELDKRLEATKRQQLAMAEVQGEQQLIMARYQAKAQMGGLQEQGVPVPGEPGGGEMAIDGSMAAQMNAGAQPEQQGAPQPAIPEAMQSPINSQQQMPEGGAGLNIFVLAQGYAQQIKQLPPDQQQLALSSIQQQMPDLYPIVQQMLANSAGSSGIPTDMRPLPVQRPPRRDTSII